jgi:putative tricarboxylic transport membrane protein
MAAEGGGSARSDIVGGACWVAFGLAIFIAAWNMDRFEKIGASLDTMPGLVPGILGSVLMLLGGALAWRGWRGRLQRRGGEPAPRALNARVVTMLVLSGVYAIGLIGRAPFWLATVAYVTLFAAWYTPPERPLARRLGVAIAVGVLTTVAVIVVFEKIFLVRLP